MQLCARSARSTQLPTDFAMNPNVCCGWLGWKLIAGDWGVFFVRGSRLVLAVKFAR